MIPPIIIFGATGVGKTTFLNTLYSYWTTKHTHSHVPSFEVIVADSRQVYKDMPISTAQTHSTIRKKIPHHLAETLDCFAPYTVGTFVTQTNTIIEQIYAHNNIPIITGGTAYYMYNLYKGIPTTPIIPHSIRSAIMEEHALYGTPYLYKKLSSLDPVYAQRISSHDTQRIVRAIEIYQYTKKPLSTFSDIPTYNPYLQHSLCIGLTRNRDALYNNINRRVHTMHKEGLLYEAYTLWQRGLNNTHNAFYTIGIQEILENTDIIKHWSTLHASNHTKETNNQTSSIYSIDSHIIDTVLTTIQKNTRHYAKRQLTFFRKLEACIQNSGNNVMWFDLEKHNSEKTICETITNFIQHTHQSPVSQSQ